MLSVPRRGSSGASGRADAGSLLPDPTRPERVADAAVHVVGLAAALLGAAFLLRTAAEYPGWLGLLAVLPYALGLAASFGCSAVYNVAPPGPLKVALRRFDHAAIFLLIAGTYTPVALLSLEWAWNAFLLTAVWLGAAAGVLLKLFAPGKHERLGLGLYLLLGWVGAVAFPALASALSRPVLLALVGGGLVYTAGVPVHLARRLPFHDAGWHALVAVAAALHFAAITLLLPRAG